MTMPMIRPALAFDRPPSWPPLASISRITRLPITHANGPTRPHTTTETMPNTSTNVACGWSGAPMPYGAPYWFGG